MVSKSALAVCVFTIVAGLSMVFEVEAAVRQPRRGNDPQSSDPSAPRDSMSSHPSSPVPSVSSSRSNSLPPGFGNTHHMQDIDLDTFGIIYSVQMDSYFRSDHSDPNNPTEVVSISQLVNQFSNHTPLTAEYITVPCMDF